METGVGMNLINNFDTSVVPVLNKKGHLAGAE